ncbi:MAG TPA: tripartite tricarboxylate transporter substrate binding protein [Pseudolabrys sp.]|nr:tripartite tricarboxylate transporter substrate binding protein [Pseudolabrys sp.]
MLRAIVAALAGTLCMVSGAAAQADYPNHPIRLIVPFAAGGSTDSQARILADFMSRELGQPLVVMNVGGAGGTIGLTQASKATPDGYTLATATPSLAINPFIQKDIGYDPLKDFETIIEVAISPIVLVVPKDSTIKSVQDLIDQAKAKPGQLRYGSAGIGSITHLSSALFTSMAGIDMVHVPYRGAGPAILDLIAGRLDVQFENAPTIMPQVKSSALRAIAVGTPQRSSTLPDLPTIGDTVNGYQASSWFGLLAPAKTPRAVIDRLNAAANKALADPTVQKQLSALGAEKIGGTPEQFTEYLKARLAEMKVVAKAANLVPQ